MVGDITTSRHHDINIGATYGYAVLWHIYSDFGRVVQGKEGVPDTGEGVSGLF